MMKRFYSIVFLILFVIMISPCAYPQTNIPSSDNFVRVQFTALDGIKEEITLMDNKLSKKIDDKSKETMDYVDKKISSYESMLMLEKTKLLLLILSCNILGMVIGSLLTFMLSRSRDKKLAMLTAKTHANERIYDTQNITTVKPNNTPTQAKKTPEPLKNDIDDSEIDEMIKNVEYLDKLEELKKIEEEIKRLS